ncbi:MAG: hypothetical protein CMG67_00630 [Candidatus Marinimicrobia bacterium]|nr:hypothetical protein [Candidatus Neomarinimicrobiota bacterium]|tara:strand:- start:18065 stop:19261 length:1197 start_codon:yes stop_codon:yes gene_type:complete
MEEKSEKLFAEINNKSIRYAVFNLSENLNYNLLTIKNSENNGIKKGDVIDIDLASEIVSKDLKEIEKKIDKVFSNVNLIINQRDMTSTYITSFKKLNGAKVEKRDIDYILNEGKISIQKNQENNSIIHILNSNFYLDKKKRDKIPLNIFADHLGLQMTLISLPKNNIKNIKNLFENNDLKVDRLLCRPLTTGVNLVSGNSKLKNFFLLNIDDELSTISIYENMSLVFFKTFPFGTNSIFRDLSQLCSIKDDDINSILTKINFNNIDENNSKYLDEKFFKDSQFTKLTLSHIKEIIETRVEEMMNHLFNKNSNIKYFKNKLSHLYVVFENKVFQEHFDKMFSGFLGIDSHKIALRLIKLEDLSLLGAAELAFKGWHAEAVPFAQEKKSLFTGVFSRFFK